MFKVLLAKLKESVLSVLPVTLAVLLLNLTPLVHLSAYQTAVFSICSLLLIIGMALFNLGADLAMTPMGEQVGSGLSRSGRGGLLLTVCFLMGVCTTVAEPDLSVLASQVENILNGTLLTVTVGVGVGLFLMLAVLRIIFRRDLGSMLMYFYMLLFALASLLILNGNRGMLPLAFDSGGVTTGPVTVPFLMALGVGISATLGGRHAGENSFGVVALCSVGPILAVAVLGLFANGELSYELPDYSMEAHLGKALIPTVVRVAKEVAIALGLVVVLFFLIQAIFLKLPSGKLKRIGIGIGYTFFGLVIFLSAVTVGFMPIGFRMGQDLANQSEAVAIASGFFLGLVTVLAEPAIHVLNRQVSGITNGSVSQRSMMIALSAGVGISIALSIVRTVLGFSILYYLIPGYFLSLGFSFFVPRIYTAIAFDSGGVASGPLTSGFILPFVIGVCTALNGTDSVMENAFGVVAMVAMTPLISIQLLGFRSVVMKKVREDIAMKRILSADDNQVIEFL